MYISRSFFTVTGLVYIAAAIFELTIPLGADFAAVRIGMSLLIIAVGIILLLVVILSLIFKSTTLSKAFSGEVSVRPGVSPRTLYLQAATMGIVVLYMLLSTIWQMWYFGLRWPGTNLLYVLFFLSLCVSTLMVARRAQRQGHGNGPWKSLDYLYSAMIVLFALGTLAINLYLFQPTAPPHYRDDQMIIPSGLAFSPDGKTIIAAGFGMIRQWDVASGQPIGQPLAGYEADTAGMGLSPDGKTVIVAEAGEYIREWDLGSRQSVSMFQNPDYGITTVALSPDGKVFASGSRNATQNNGVIVLWDAVRGWPIGLTLTANGYGVNAMAFSPDGKILVSGNNDLMFWDVRAGSQIELARQPTITGQITGLAYSPDGKILAVAAGNGITLWDAVTGEPFTNPALVYDASKFSGIMSSVAFSADGKRLAGASGNALGLWDVTTGQLIGQPLTGHTLRIRCLAFSPDGKMLASGSDDMSIRLWDLSQNPPISKQLT